MEDKGMDDHLKEKVEGMTQRLDHMVPDPDMTATENRAAAAELKSLSDALYELLPDKSLSPFERLERLGRVVEPRDPHLEDLQSAATKLQRLKDRINELVPGEGSPHEKLIGLELALDEQAGVELSGQSVISKLEKLGDPRGRIEPE